MTSALLLPVHGPVQAVTLNGPAGSGDLDQLQELVGGNIQALPLPEFLDPEGEATAYINEDGKYTEGCSPNMRATDLLVPGIGLFFGDHIAGPMVLCGFNARTGAHADLPDGVARRVRLIELEAGL